MSFTGTQFAYPGATATISSNGTSSGIVWAIEQNTSQAILHAYNATNLGNELYNSNQTQIGGAVKFAVPTVSNGKVFVGTANSVAVFGLLPPGPHYVQGNSASPPNSQTSVQVAYKSAQTAGNLNVVFIAWNNNSGSVSSVTDTLGNTYTKAIGPTVSSVSPTRSQAVYYCSNIKSGSGNTVKVTMSAAEPWIDVRILEYTGPWVYDSSVGAIGNSATASSGTVATTANNDLLVSGTYSDAGTTGAGPGFTQRVKTQNWASAEDEVAGTAGSYSDSTSLVGSTVWVSQMVAFKP